MKRNPIASDVQRFLRLTPRGMAAAARRKGRLAVSRLAEELRARVHGTAIGDREFRAACRPEAGDPTRLFAEGGWFLHQGFFMDGCARRRAAAWARRAGPDSVQTIESAERICAHRFDLLGSGLTDLGPDIDWHRDFKSGFRWDPRVFSARLRYGDVRGADVKVPWELSRCQHFPALGKAYWFTGNDRYAAELVAQLTHWIAENPAQFGVNWSCTMDVAIRAFNWLWGYAFVHDAPEVTLAFRRALAGSLLAHGRHIQRNLERGADGITSNHYLANLVGLMGLGFACPMFHEARMWKEFSLAETFREIERQVHPDGGDYESSIPYHRLVAEMFLAVAILCRRNGIALPEAFSQRLQRMLDFTLAYTKPNGLAPQVGDADDGRLHILADYGRWDPRDHRHLLATGGAFFDRADLYAAAGEQVEEAFWLVGDYRQADPGFVFPPPGSRAFSDSGIFVMREGPLYVLISCGAVGTKSIGNHKHNDVLSFEFHVDGHDLIVDPGSYLYTPEPMWRDRFRSTAVHSTLMVDNMEQNRFGEGGLFWLHADANPRCLAWESGAGVDRFVGEHDGYARLAEPVIHRREFRLDKRARRLAITDWLQGHGRHALDWNFTLAPGVVPRPVGEGQWEVAVGKTRAVLRLAGMRSDQDHRLAHAVVAETFVSPRYGVKAPACALRVHVDEHVPLECRFQIEVR
jgi:hypothetical protein